MLLLTYRKVTAAPLEQSPPVVRAHRHKVHYLRFLVHGNAFRTLDPTTDKLPGRCGRRASATDHANACQVSLYLMMPHHIDVHVDVPDHIDQWSADPKGAIVEAFHNARGAIAERLGHPHGKRHTPSR